MDSAGRTCSGRASAGGTCVNGQSATNGLRGAERYEWATRGRVHEWAVVIKAPRGGGKCAWGAFGG